MSPSDELPSGAAGVDAEILRRCDTLAALSAQQNAICRVYLSSEHQAANAQVLEWMREAGMTAYVDACGNVRGHYAGDHDNAQVLLIGSHLDTVPDAGAYDGILGVLLGISVVGQLAKQGKRLPFAIEVIGFGEEEGVRFGTTLMTSRALAGTWDSSWWSLQDEDGVSLAQAFQNFGLEPDSIEQARLSSEQLLGYVEAHIEQGPVLEAREAPLGVVTAIAGARRFRICIKGHAGHAGTTPMNLRQDALVGAAQAVAQVEEIALKHDVVATVGQIGCEPGGVNVIPRAAEFSLDIRSGDDTQRDAAMDEWLSLVRKNCDQRGLTLDVEETHAAGAVPCAPALQSLMSQAIEEAGLPAIHLPSGAGHDAMAIADVCDVAMLFIRSPGGISHNPAERVIASDVGLAHDVLMTFLHGLAAQRADAR